MLKQIINKHWHLLQITSNLRIAFEQEPLIAYRRNKNLGSKKILDGKVVRKNNSKKQLYCRPCLTRRDLLPTSFENKHLHKLQNWQNLQNFSSIKL